MFLQHTKGYIILTLALLLFYFYGTQAPIANAQQQLDAVMSGRITDESTNKPLENVIVFLENTGWGISTDTLGKFVIPDIEPGEYDLIVSRVGYIKQLKHIMIKENDTLSYEIKLVAQPIQAGEMEVIGERIESAEHKLNLFPSTKDNSYCVYGVETSLPIGILFTDNAIFMYALEPTMVGNEKYVRLWLLYLNLSRDPHYFNPYERIKFHLISKKSYYRNISADFPSEVQTRINNEDAIDTAEQVISRQIQRMAIHHRIALKHELRFLQGMLTPEQYYHYIANDIIRGPISGISWDNILSRSVNDGILKPHIIYPNNSVHGFLFFPYPGLEWIASDNRFYEAFENQYELEIITPTETKTIVFTAH